MSEATTTTQEPQTIKAGADGDDRTYRWASLVLRLGMYISFGTMVAGLVWWLFDGLPGGINAAQKGIPLDQLLSQLASLNPLALLNIGVLLLLATPGVTLLAQIASYVAARNWRFAGVATLVVAILLLSLAVSLKWIKLF